MLFRREIVEKPNPTRRLSGNTQIIDWQIRRHVSGFRDLQAYLSILQFLDLEVIIGSDVALSIYATWQWSGLWQCKDLMEAVQLSAILWYTGDGLAVVSLPDIILYIFVYNIIHIIQNHDLILIESSARLANAFWVHESVIHFWPRSCMERRRLQLSRSCPSRSDDSGVDGLETYMANDRRITWVTSWLIIVYS